MAGGGSLLFSGYTVLRTRTDGAVEDPNDGLLHEDTRVLSRYGLTLDGRRPELVVASQPESDCWEAVLHVPHPSAAEASADGPVLPQDALELHVARRVGPGMSERLTVRNHSAIPTTTELRLTLDADFADVLELSSERRLIGRVNRTAQQGRAIRFDYEVEHAGRRAERGLRVLVRTATTPAQIDEDICFDLSLEPRGTWSAVLVFEALVDGDWRGPDRESGRRELQRRAWRRSRTVVEGPAAVTGPFERASDDLYQLRNMELERRLLASDDGSRWVVNAGAPMFTGLFGRDIITAGWQSAMLGVAALRGALDAVAATAARHDDPWRDAEPGKLIHELRSGPLSETGLSPRSAYYGSQTTPAMFVLALSELWHWTGDMAVLRRHRATAAAAMAWADRYGDSDRDGFLEYQRRSPEGLRNQGWKDSDEAVRHDDGSPVQGPIATVEEQAFRILALERWAEIRTALGEDRGAEIDLVHARRLRANWHERYWMPDAGYYALALDGAKRQVRSIASNPGHALGAGVVPPEHARTVADRLLGDDLFSGWGVRSLSAIHPSYNPFAYHLGAMWPVEQATFALGCKRYGLDDHVDRLVEGLLAAALASPACRLPEALSGHRREPGLDPVPYPTANSPQAWSSSALVQMIQVALGLYPFAPLHLLALVRPRLPTGVDELIVRKLRIGKARVDLRFARRDDGSVAWRVLRRHGPLVVVEVGPPAGHTAGGREAVQRLFVSHAPGRLGRAGRIALGFG